MSKPVAKAKKKQKRAAEIAEVFDPKAQRKLEKSFRNHIMEMDERAEEREHFSRVILDANEPEALDVVDQIIESLKKMNPAGHNDSIHFEGHTFRPLAEEQATIRSIQERNFRYIAVRTLIACAEWNIRVNNFKLPKHNCARCGKKVK